MRQLKIDLAKCDGGRDCEHECEDACATKVFKLDGPKFAALHIQAGAAGESTAVLCDQCGDCVMICPSDALKRNKLGVVMIDKKLCVACYACVGFCDKGAFQRNPDWMEPFKCTACGICVKACPHVALEMVDVPLPASRIV